MRHAGIARAGTGLAVGALLTAPLLAIFLLGPLVGAPATPFAVFERLFQVLPARVVNFGLDLMIRALDGLGLDIAAIAKVAEQVLAVFISFVAGLLVGLLFFVLVRRGSNAKLTVCGLGLGAAVGAFVAALVLSGGVPVGLGGRIGFAVWVLVLFTLWGWGFAFMRRVTLRGGAATVVAADAPQADVRAISRRRFIVQMGGLAATIVVAGAGVAAVLRAESTPAPDGTDTAPIAFPNEGSPIEPVPGTRPEYTAVTDHFRNDINLGVPRIDGSAWRLTVGGLVEEPLSLSLDQIRFGFRSEHRFVTLSCISNMLGGPLIGTTLWTGVPLRDVLARARPLDDARWIRMTSADGYDEEIDLELVRGDPRIMLTYAWDGLPLPEEHGFPLRVCVPDRYGMKQPKWISDLELTSVSTPGYWVARNWEERAEVRTVSVIDTVAVKSPVERDGVVHIPIGGIAHSGAKGISKVEVQVDDGPWQTASLREPLSELTWVLWRFDWPFSPGTHWFAVRAYDGQGRLQETEETDSGVGTAVTGLYRSYRTIEPIEP